MDLNKNTLSEQIYQILRSDILSLKIPLGEKLTLKTLKERFEVSSTPIREALTRLNEEGLVCYYSNIGVSVIEPNETDLKELYQFMGDLDALAILYTSGNPRQEEVLEKLQENIRSTAVIRTKEKLTPEETALWISHSDRFHLIFYDFCRNSRLTLAAERLRSQLTIFSNLYETEDLPQKSIYESHAAIYEAYRDGDYQTAASRMRSHLEDSLQYALECLKKM
ncbi:MAG: GntR family transcriptional regulator [Candidatus Limivivens sp.]|nr:GntR family transcriptional regulator [Candidatus Limivivens sp.]